jgi:predicted nucleic acid-binding Zn ribbon protein
MKKRSIIETDPDKFVQIVKNAKTISEIIRMLGYKCSGGMHSYIKTKIAKLNLDVSHLKGRGWSKNLNEFTDIRIRQKVSIRVPSEEIFKTGTVFRHDRILKRLLLDGRRERKCECCKLTKWLGGPIPLHVHHKNKIRTDNRDENLEVLCPNCHMCKHEVGLNYAQVEGGVLETKKYKTETDIFCKQCNGQIKEGNKFCSDKCSNKYHAKRERQTKINWPLTKDLLDIIKLHGNLTQAGKFLGVSDNAIRKRLRNHPVLKEKGDK